MATTNTHTVRYTRTTDGRVFEIHFATEAAAEARFQRVCGMATAYAAVLVAFAG